MNTLCKEEKKEAKKNNEPALVLACLKCAPPLADQQHCSPPPHLHTVRGIKLEMAKCCHQNTDPRAVHILKVRVRGDAGNGSEEQLL